MRLAVAGHAVVDEDLAARVARWDLDGLAERHRLALRYARAYMTEPAAIDAELRSSLRAAFTRPELVELSLDVMAFNKQKTSVALGTDRAVAEGALTELVFDDDGHFRFGRRWRPDTAP